MAHSTGLHWVEDYKAEFHNKEYAVFCFRLRNYYHEMMSDSPEPTYRNLNEYEITVAKFRKKGNGLVADHLSEQCRTGSIDKDMANKVWWNLKHRDFTFEDCKRIFKAIAGKELR